MIAKVIPIKRLPKSLEILDYTVPIEMEETLELGMLVKIPIRSAHFYGVIFALDKDAKKSSSKIKDIVEISLASPILSRRQLHEYHIISKWYCTALSTLLKMALLPMQKRKLAKLELKHLPQKTEKNTPSSQAFFYRTENERIAYITNVLENTTGQVLILLPEIQMLKKFVNALTEDQKESYVLWHSGMSVKEQYATWVQIRNGEKRIIIGNRSAILIPFFNLTDIIIDHEHDDGHKHWDQTPRFHTSDIATLKQSIYGLAIHRLSYSPSVSLIASSPKLLEEIKAISDYAETSPIVVDMRSQRSGYNYSVLSEPVRNQILSGSGDIFLFLNKRGFASALACRDCGYTNDCPKCNLPFVYHASDNSLRCHYCHTRGTIVLNCADCHSTMVRLRGGGTQLIEKTIKELLADSQSPYQIIRIDADTPDVTLPKDSSLPRIIIGTSKALPLIRWEKTKLIAFTSLDQQLAIPELYAHEQIWHLIQEVQYLRTKESSFYIQTMNPEHHIFKMLASPASFYERELEVRKTHKYPPSAFLVRYMIALPKDSAASQVASQSYQVLKEALTKADKTISIYPPYKMHPGFYRAKHWYAILVRIETEHWMNDLLWINRFVGNNWRVDPHPISLLSP